MVLFLSERIDRLTGTLYLLWRHFNGNPILNFPRIMWLITASSGPSVISDELYIEANSPKLFSAASHEKFVKRESE